MLALAEAAYRRHLQRRRARFRAATIDLGVPVISVGNLTLGGTGKTPAVQWLARSLQPHLTPNGNIGIVARGYRGSARGTAVVSDGHAVLLDAGVAGDEPLLHAQALPGTIVTIGRDREDAARAAMELGAKLLILDDAFSYWSLRRDFELVLLDARRPFGSGHLLPRGRLREEPQQLQRADAVILTRSDLASPDELERAEVQVRRLTTAPVFRARHAASALRRFPDGGAESLALLRGTSIGMFSAVADNEAFKSSLQALGATVVAERSQRDHHAWSDTEVEAALGGFARAGAAFAVTTAKDAVKLSARDWPLPLYVLDIALRIDGSNELLQRVREALKI